MAQEFFTKQQGEQKRAQGLYFTAGRVNPFVLRSF